MDCFAESRAHSRDPLARNDGQTHITWRNGSLLEARPGMTEDRDYFGLESGGQSGLTFSGLPPLCTVGAAELAPPASGRTALFSIAIEFDVFSSPWPEVAAGEVVQLVSGFCPVVAGCAIAAPVSEAARTAAAIRSSTQTSGELVFHVRRQNFSLVQWFRPAAALRRSARIGAGTLGASKARRCRAISLQPAFIDETGFADATNGSVRNYARGCRNDPWVFQASQSSQLILARLCRSVASGRLVRRSCAAMQRSDSVIFRFRLAASRCCAALRPTLNWAISNAFNASRFFFT